MMRKILNLSFTTQMDTLSTREKSKTTKGMVMESVSVRKKKTKKFLKATGKMIKEMAKELYL